MSIAILSGLKEKEKKVTYYDLVIDTPIPSVQPILVNETTLHTDIVTGWCYYFVSANDGVSTHYKLQKSRQSNATIIDQVFDMNGAGMRGIDNQVEFTYISEDRTEFTIRFAGARVNYYCPTGKKITGIYAWIKGAFDYPQASLRTNVNMEKVFFRNGVELNFNAFGFFPNSFNGGTANNNEFDLNYCAEAEIEEVEDLLIFSGKLWASSTSKSATYAMGVKQDGVNTYVNSYSAALDNGYRFLLNGTRIKFRLEDI